MKSQNQSFQYGFTLIEVLAVMAIIGVLSAVAIPSGINFWANLQIEETQNNINRALRSARTNARSSNTGQIWQVRVEDSQIIVEDAASNCNELTSCQRITIPNLVEVAVAPTGFIAAFNTRGEAINLGRFEISSPNLTQRDRCVRVSTILGSIRNDNNPACSGIDPNNLEGSDDQDG